MTPANANHGVWLAAVRLSDVDLGLEHLLDGSELARANTFRSRALRERFIAGRLALRLHVSALTGDNPGALRADYFCPSCRNRNGKGHGLPRYELPSTTTTGSLHVSLSRSETWCLLAASLNEGIAGIGVDLETGSSADFSGFDSLALSPNERSQLQTVPSALKNAFQTRLWCRKEAVLKALGTGLATAPSLLDVSGSTPAAPGSPPGLEPWKVEDISPASIGLPHHFAASLAISFERNSPVQDW